MGPHADNFPCSPGETQCKYNLYRLLGAWLFSRFPSRNPEDGLVSRWIRQRDERGFVTSFRGLGTTLMEAPFRDRVPGEDPAAKVGTLLHRFGTHQVARHLPPLPRWSHSYFPQNATRAHHIVRPSLRP